MGLIGWVAEGEGRVSTHSQVSRLIIWVNCFGLIQELLEEEQFGEIEMEGESILGYDKCVVP